MKRGKKERGVYEIAARYLIIVLLSLGGFKILYFIFAPLTFYPLVFILRLFYNVGVVGNKLFIGQNIIEISGACIAVSAYYLLALLNITTRGIKIKNRVKMFLFHSVLILVPNILRIILLTALKVNGSAAFDLVHKVIWYFIGTVYIVLIWFAGVYTLKIKSMPFYSDFIYMKSTIKRPKKRP